MYCNIEPKLYNLALPLQPRKGSLGGPGRRLLDFQQDCMCKSESEVRYDQEGVSYE